MRRAQIGVLELQTTTLQAWPRGLRLVCIAGRLVEHVALARDGRAPTRKKWRGVPEGSVRHMLEGGTNSLGCVQMQRQGADGALLVVLVDADVVIVEV